MKLLIVTIIMTACIFKGYAQSNDDDRHVVGVAEFSCNENSPYTGLVTEKVVEMLTNSKRFRVVDRTSRDKIAQELELQKSEAFIAYQSCNKSLAVSLRYGWSEAIEIDDIANILLIQMPATPFY